MKRGHVVVSYVAALTFSIAGCGGETADDPSPAGASGGVACGVVPECGGDATGTWKLAAECVSGTPTHASCPDETVDVSATVTGTATYDGSGSFQLNATFGIYMGLGVPASCLKGVASCESLAGQAEAQLAGSTATCSGTPSTSCECTIQASFTGSASGTYQIENGRIVETHSDGRVFTRRYCVRDGTLTLMADNSDGTTTTIVATK